MDIGRSLLDVKEKLDHGQFQDWLKAEFAWTSRTAQNYMNVAKNEKFSFLDTLPVSALYLIASPTAPDEAVEEIVGRAEAGEKVTVAEVKSTLKEHKDSEQLSHRDSVIRLLVENNGRMHQGILVSRSKIHPKIFAGTIQSLLDDGTVIRQGAFYQLASEATSNDVVALSSDLAEQIIPLVAAKADGITYADIRSGLELKQTDHHGLLALRRALDILLGSQQITKAGALYRVAESATAADETPQAMPGEDEPAPAGDLASRILDALRHGQQWTVPQLQMVLGGSVRKPALIDTIEALIDAGKLVKHTGAGSVLPRIALAAPPSPVEGESAEDEPSPLMQFEFETPESATSDETPLEKAEALNDQFVTALPTADAEIAKNYLCDRCRERPSAFYSDEFGGEVCAECAEVLDNDDTVVSDLEDSADPTPRESAPEHPRQPMSLDVAKSLIHDALRGSQRPLGRGEMRKYAGISQEDRKVAEQAIDVLLEKGVIAEVQDGTGRRYHYADLIAKMTSPAEDRAAALDFMLINATSAINLALKAPAPDWGTMDATRRNELIALLRQAEDAADALLHRIADWRPTGAAAD